MRSIVCELLTTGAITNEHLELARIRQLSSRLSIQKLLIEMGFLKEEHLLEIAARISNTYITDLAREEIDIGATKVLPLKIAKLHNVFPICVDGNFLVLATSDPQDIIAKDDIERATRMCIKPVIAPRSAIEQYIDKYYHIDDKISELLNGVPESMDVEKFDQDNRIGLVLQDSFEGESVPAVKLTNIIISNSVKARASDIHIEPTENSSKVRYRIDGDLRSVMDIPIHFHRAIVARVKILSDLDIAESRKPHDGRCKILVKKRSIDLRVSIIPTFYGQKVSIRVLDPAQSKVSLDKIGMEKEEKAIFKEAISNQQGMVLVTGPTGSGKTSTLYAGLNYIKHETKNIITIEDPIEYIIEGVSQMQLNSIKNVTFANGLRSILRQDPNIILVGEIRDRETADMAFRSSLTGHLVLSSLHTNSAAASIVRLVDLGLEPYIIASSIVLVVSQRLLKVVCQYCKEEYIPNERLMKDFRKYIKRFNIKKFYRGNGCNHCDNSGYYGRTAIFEMLQVNDEIKALIAGRASENKIAEAAKLHGMRTLITTGMEKVSNGITTLEEVYKEIGIRQEDKTADKTIEPRWGRQVLSAEEEDEIMKLLGLYANSPS